ncbi:hypothetical protein [Lacipirellula sp.]|uniref:hypothetical protein n=1 Tax=Lacipirellula sp. TaxID=2691419 RepID=UPI003D10AED2
MNASSISEIEQLVSKERAAVATALEEARKQLASLEADIKKLNAVENALAGTTSLKVTKTRAKPLLPAVGKPEVIQFMQSVLEQHVILEEKVLKQHVEQLAQQSGYSRLGIGMRIKDAFSDPRFTVTADGVRLSLRGSLPRPVENLG